MPPSSSQRFARLSKCLTEMGMASSQSRSWGWPCVRWATCPMRWSWRLSSKDLTRMVRRSLSAAYHPTYELCTSMFLFLSVPSGDGQVGFEEFVTLLGPKLSAAGMPDKFHGADFDSVFWKVGTIIIRLLNKGGQIGASLGRVFFPIKSLHTKLLKLLQHIFLHYIRSFNIFMPS